MHQFEQKNSQKFVLLDNNKKGLTYRATFKIEPIPIGLFLSNIYWGGGCFPPPPPYDFALRVEMVQLLKAFSSKKKLDL